MTTMTTMTNHQLEPWIRSGNQTKLCFAGLWQHLWQAVSWRSQSCDICNMELNTCSVFLLQMHNTTIEQWFYFASARSIASAPICFLYALIAGHLIFKHKELDELKKKKKESRDTVHFIYSVLWTDCWMLHLDIFSSLMCLKGLQKKLEKP